LETLSLPKFAIDSFVNVSPGDKDGGGLMRGIVGQPWFIATLIGIIGGTLWLALCIFSIWLYRKRRAGKKVKKNGSLGGETPLV